ncbi:Scr1 family TA system antitoxin-like transcriptional regulator [Nocardia sp. NPDC005366]|uniref:Scr1 family TA system antitoxin-like transcriptional regulator n=1 Tax=Nocardia sp. NPDC005366 TaxID=3156878 RepID=UPI0033B67D2B
MAPTSPTVAGWELVLRIRQRVNELGLTSRQIQKTLGIGPTYWSQITNYKGVLTENKLAALADLLEFPAEQRRELLELRGLAKERGWWNRYSTLFDEGTLRYLGLEAGATHLKSYESSVIPALLQTEDYIRALMTSSVAARPTEAEELVRARLERQQRLRGEEPVLLSVVLGQAALMQQVGGVEVQRAQLRYLVSAIEDLAATVDVRVIPFEVDTAAAVNAATFTVLEFASPRLPTIGRLESATWSELIEESRVVEQLKYQYLRARSSALEMADSVALIEQIERGLTG